MALVLVLGAMPQSPIAHPAKAQDETPIVIGTLDLPTILDPALADTFMEWEILSHLYVGLTRQVPGTTTYELAAATRHEVSSNGITHTFTLRDDLVFGDGSPITAQAFERSIQRVRTLDRDGAAMMNGVVSDVVALDDLTLQFRLEAAIPYFDALVSLPPFFAVPSSDFPSGRVPENQQTLIGNGVYVLKSRADGPVLTLVPNPRYQFGDAASNTGIVLHYYPDTEALRMALVSGAIDVAWRDVRLPEAVATAASNSAIEIATIPSVRMWYLLINTSQLFADTTADPIFRDVFVKMFDREFVIESYFDGLLSPAYSLVPPLVGEAYQPIYTSYTDSEEAIRVLTDNGYSPNRPVFIGVATSQELYGSYHANAVNTLRVGLTSVNRYINVSGSTNFVAVTFVERLQQGAFPAPVFAYTPIVPHPDAYLRPLLHSESPMVRTNNYAQSEVDVLLNQARRTTDIEAQNAAYQEVQALVQSTNTLVPLWQDVVSVLYQAEIGGVLLEPNYFLHYDLLTRQ